MRKFLAVFLILFALQATARDFPEKPVRLIVPLPPGGATDVVARLIAQKLGDAWGQPVVLEHRPGGGTVIGAQAVAAAPPDGYTLGIVISALTINPSLRKDLPYDTLKDFAPLTQIGNTVMARLAELGIDVVASAPEEFGAFIRAEIRKWAPVVRASGATAD